MKTVFVTGGIGSGKSTVCAILREKGIPVYDSDGETKSLYDRRPELLEALEDLWGVPLRGGDGRIDRRIDRRRLSSLIFSDPLRREQLEAVVYPAVREDFLQWKDRQGTAPFVVLESAVVLSKPQFASLADRVVLVEASPRTRLARAMARDGADAASVRARMEAQETDFPGVDDRIRNEGTLQELREEVDRVFGPLF